MKAFSDAFLRMHLLVLAVCTAALIVPDSLPARAIHPNSSSSTNCPITVTSTFLDPPSSDVKNLELPDPYGLEVTLPSQLHWPTNASRIITSTFGETRSAHLHAGIDIRTWGREGYDVYAMHDGSISRIQTGPSGYGNVIYLNHAEGSSSVYAHLNRFEPNLQAYIDSVRLAQNRSIVDLTSIPESFRYRAGELIGFTGSTGTGPPHLHIEIRNRHNEPINPLLTPLRTQINDTRVPAFEALAIEHLSNDSYHFLNYQIYPPKPQKAASGAIDFGEIEIHGPVGLAADMVDRLNGTRNRYAVYEWMMMIESDTLFHARADRFPFQLDQLMFLDRSYPILAQTGKGFHRFYVVHRNELPFYRQLSNKGVLLLPPGSHEVELVANDIFGNTSRARVRLVQTDTNILPSGRLSERENQLTGLHKSTSLNRSERTTRPGSRRESIADDNHPTAKKKTVAFVPTYPLPSSMHDISNLSPPYAQYPAVRPVFPETLAGVLQTSINMQAPPHTTLSLTNQPGTMVLNGQQLTFYAVAAPGHSTILHTPDQRIRLIIPKDALYDSLKIALHVHWNNGLPSIRFDPDRLPVFEPLLLDVLLPDSIDASTTGIYGRNPHKNTYLFLGADHDPAGNRIQAPVLEIAELHVLRDQAPPATGIPVLQKNLAGAPIVTVPVEDEQSGIHLEQSEIQVNGIPGITDYDPDRNLLIYSHPFSPPKTLANVQIKAVDGVGNSILVRYANGELVCSDCAAVP